MVTEFPFGTSSNKSDSCQTHLGRYWANSSPPPHHLVTYVNKDAKKNQFLPDFSQKKLEVDRAINKGDFTLKRCISYVLYNNLYLSHRHC